jgi:hypothetical protein
VDADGTLECCHSGKLVPGKTYDYCTDLNLTVGTACAIDQQCETGLCQDSVCAAPNKAANEACSYNDQCFGSACGRIDADGNLACCPSGKLVEGKWLDYCTDLNLTIGEACAIHQQCETGICNDGQCAAPKRNAGDACEHNDQCLGSACGRDDEAGDLQCCVSGSLVKGDLYDFCAELPAGHSCDRNSQCTNGKCGRADKGNLQCCRSGKFIEGEVKDECQDVPQPDAYYWRVAGDDQCCHTDDPDKMPSGDKWVAISPAMAVAGGCQNEAKRGGAIGACTGVVPRAYFWTRYLSKGTGALDLFQYRSAKDCCKVSSVAEMPVGEDFVALGDPGFCETPNGDPMGTIPDCKAVTQRLYHWRVNSNTGQCCTTTRPDFRPVNASWVPIENGNGFNCPVCEEVYQTTSNDQGNYTVVQAGCAPVASCSLTGYNCLALGCFCTTGSSNCMTGTHCDSTGWNSDITFLNQIDWGSNRVCLPESGLNKALDIILPIVVQALAECILGAEFTFGIACAAAFSQAGGEEAATAFEELSAKFETTIKAADTATTTERSGEKLSKVLSKAIQDLEKFLTTATEQKAAVAESIADEEKVLEPLKGEGKFDVEFTSAKEQWTTGRLKNIKVDSEASNDALKGMSTFLQSDDVFLEGTMKKVYAMQKFIDDATEFLKNEPLKQILGNVQNSKLSDQAISHFIGTLENIVKNDEALLEGQARLAALQQQAAKIDSMIEQVEEKIDRTKISWRDSLPSRIDPAGYHMGHPSGAFRPR